MEHRYHRHAELCAAVREIAAAHPALVTVTEIARSVEGRELLVATVSAPKNGGPDEKSGYWIDANIHAEELAGSTAALHALHHLATEYGRDPAVTDLLDHHAVHICPRVCPDGAERCFTQREGKLRSSVRSWPLEDALPGLQAADVDGDGEILQMRIRDDNGPWRQSSSDPRLLVRRRPEDREGVFYRLYREGTIRDDRGILDGKSSLRVPPNRAGLDLNRNFPFEWQNEIDQKGAGPFPLSEPETRAIAAYVAARPSIVGAVTYHTFSGVILRPYSTRSDETMARGDLARYRAIGELGTRLTGYPCRSVFHGFYHPGDPLTRGAFDDWCFDALGIFAFTTELWSIGKAAGLTVDDFMAFFKGRSEADELAILAWNDRELDGKGFAPWRKFSHSQLGEVELGGWRTLFTWSNPPERFLREICASNCRFTVEHAALGPRLQLSLAEESIGRAENGERLRKIVATVENRGWLPTQVVSRPPAGERARPVELSISGAPAIVVGSKTIAVGHLHGRSQLEDERAAEPVFFEGVDHAQVARAEWVVRGEGTVTVVASAPRAGRVARTIGGR
jgi:murein tripeptide amidase MpaA